MPLDIPAIQRALADEGLDGWLLYDFHGSNPVAASLVGLEGSGKMTTRRWYYLVPRNGEPRGLVHAIERHNLSHLPGGTRTYAGRESLERELDALLAGVRRVAMEYSPRCAIPYVSRVDAGTVEAVRDRGVEVVSSGDLVQRFQALWNDRAYALHCEASDSLYRIKDRAFAEVSRRLRDRVPTTEYDIQALMMTWFEDEGLETDSAPIVGAQEHAGDPHYVPSAAAPRVIRPDEVLLLDLWGRKRVPDAVFADITWMGFTGGRVPDQVQRAFAAVTAARDAATALVRDASRAGRDLRGWEVDRAARAELDGAGFGAHVLHRTGHSLGRNVHGDGVHMDDYETHDDRRLLPGTAFTVEPGLYFDTFGVRTEINVFVTDGDALVSGPVQDRVVTLAP